MRKLKLSLENLQVETFVADVATDRLRGTVDGKESWPGETEICESNEYTCTTGPRPTLNLSCVGPTCPPAKTCYVTE